MVEMSVARNKVPVVSSSWPIRDTGYRLESGLRANREAELEFLRLGRSWSTLSAIKIMRRGYAALEARGLEL